MKEVGIGEMRQGETRENQGKQIRVKDLFRDNE